MIRSERVPAGGEGMREPQGEKAAVKRIVLLTEAAFPEIDPFFELREGAGPGAQPEPESTPARPASKTKAPMPLIKATVD